MQHAVGGLAVPVTRIGSGEVRRYSYWSRPSVLSRSLAQGFVTDQRLEYVHRRTTSATRLLPVGGPAGPCSAHLHFTRVLPHPISPIIRLVSSVPGQTIHHAPCTRVTLSPIFQQAAVNDLVIALRRYHLAEPMSFPRKFYPCCT